MSIRGRLSRLLLMTIVPLVLIVGASLFLFVRTSVIARFDDGLLARAEAMAGMVEYDAGRVEHEFAEDVASPESEVRQFYQLWMLEGEKPTRVVARSGSLEGDDLPARVQKLSAPQVAWNAEVGNARKACRLIAMRFVPQVEEEEVAGAGAAGEAPELLLVVARERHELDHTLTLLGAALGGAGLLVIGGVLIAVRVALARGLGPIDELGAQVQAIEPSDLSVRVSEAGVPSELKPISARVNSLLERVASAFEREKRLAASAAHQLRTPLTEIRAATELSLSRERSVEEYRRTLATVLAAAERMGESTDAVLRLARVQSGRERPLIETIDLREAVMPALKRWIEPRAVRAELEIGNGVLVRADRSMLGVVLENLLQNAAGHTPAGGRVRVSATSENADRVTLEIRNAVGVGERGDDDAVHVGLGLVIARAMCEVCGGTLEAELRGDEFVVGVGLAGV